MIARPVENDKTDPALAAVLKNSDAAHRIDLTRCRDLVAECREKLSPNNSEPHVDDGGTDEPPA